MRRATGWSCNVKDILPGDRELALIDLTAHQCRFPVREDPTVPGGHRFCARAIVPGQVYCAHHHSVATMVELRRGGGRFVIGQKRAA